MRTRIYAGFGLVAMVAMVVAAIIVTNPLSTEAAVDDSLAASASDIEVSSRVDVISVEHATQPDGIGQLQAAPDTESEAKPYIGVVIQPLADGSVKVVKVLPDGPSDGSLEAGDVITAVNGESVDGVESLTDAIADSSAGETLTLTITRDGSEMDVSVTIGEWTKKTYRMGRVFHKAKSSRDRIASRQVVKADDDGNYRTYRTVYGNVTALDADAGTFTLQPKDGSDAISYSVNDDTRIYVGKDRVDDLTSLNTDEQTAVMDIDGEVKLVKSERYLGGEKWIQASQGMASGIRAQLSYVHQIVLLGEDAQINGLAWRRGAALRRGHKAPLYAGSYFLEKPSALRGEHSFKAVLRVQLHPSIADVIEDRMRTEVESFRNLLGLQRHCEQAQHFQFPHGEGLMSVVRGFGKFRFGRKDAVNILSDGLGAGVVCLDVEEMNEQFLFVVLVYDEGRNGDRLSLT